MKPVRWGVISTARIGTEKVLPGMMKSKLIDMQAIASRDLKLAQHWARKLGIRKAYGSYEELLADPDIEAVYNPLPNHLHVPLTVSAVRAGKHVLCEKPIAMNAAEASLLLDLPDGQLVAEAIVVRHHPQWIETRKRVRAGQIGQVRAIQCLFSYFLSDPKNVRNIADIGGGGIYDIGGYPVVIARYIFGAEPTRAISLVERDPIMKIDRLTSAIVDFGEGRRLDFTISTQLAPYQRVHIMGTEGRIEVEIPFNAPLGKKTRLYIDKGTKRGAASAKLIPIRSADQYRLQSEAFSRAVRGVEKLIYGVEDAVRQMRVLDAVFRSEETGHWETV